jgi:mitotic spindle assembly checkpoint protein MAD2
MTKITLQASKQVLRDFFYYSLNAILYQRELYDQSYFADRKHYNLVLKVVQDAKLNDYLLAVIAQLEAWLETNQLERFVMVIVNPAGIVKERWQFDITMLDTRKESENDVSREIAAVIRQITASSGFLPLFNEKMTFNVLAYTSKDVCVPEKWVDSDPKYIKDSCVVKLRSFTTQDSRVDSLVSYQIEN